VTYFIPYLEDYMVLNIKSASLIPCRMRNPKALFLAGQGTVGPGTPGARISAFPPHEFTLEHNKLF